MVLVLLIGGLVALVLGAEVLVRGASRLAAAFGISSLVIGLTVVAFGTSAPELAVSVRAALAGGGAADVAVGNVVGSNIFNVLVILGIAALVSPLVVAERLVRLEVPLMILVSLIAWWLCADGSVARVEGLGLIAGIVAFTIFLIYRDRRAVEPAAMSPQLEVPRGWQARALDVAWVVAGLVLLVIGARWLVEGAVAVARGLGVSELVISLTVVAAGTSLPELATSVLASARGERDIAVGNVVGSNVFNLLAVLGTSAAVAPIAVAPVAVRFDFAVMSGVAVLCLPVFWSGFRISRLEGFFFLTVFAAYTTILIITARHPEARVVTRPLLWLPIAFAAIVWALPMARRRTPSA